MYDIVRIGWVWQAAGVKVTKFEPNLIEVKQQPREGTGLENQKKSSSDAVSTNVQLEGTIL